MRRLLFPVICALMIAGLGIGTRFTHHPPSTNTAIAAHPPTNPTIEALRTELEKATQQELKNGCTEWDPRTGQYLLCGASKERVEALHARLVEEVRKAEQRDPESIARVTGRIRAMMEAPSLEVTFQGTSANPYLAQHRMEIYQDNRGMMYFVDPATDQVFQFGPGPNSTVQFCMSPQVSMDELRQRAESFLTKNVPDFALVKEKWVYAESSKGGTSFLFRWEAPDVPDGEKTPPFLQVVLSPCGEIMSFNNTYGLWGR